MIFDCFGVLTSVDANGANETLFEFIRDELKQRYKIGMLSNAGGNVLDMLFEPWQVQLFDEVVLSYQTGMVKPDPGIYELTAHRLGVSTDECIFVDDIQRYCDAAIDMGMKAIWHQDTAETIKKIKELIDA